MVDITIFVQRVTSEDGGTLLVYSTKDRQLDFAQRGFDRNRAAIKVSLRTVIDGQMHVQTIQNASIQSVVSRGILSIFDVSLPTITLGDRGHLIVEISYNEDKHLHDGALYNEQYKFRNVLNLEKQLPTIKMRSLRWMVFSQLFSLSNVGPIKGKINESNVRHVSTVALCLVDHLLSQEDLDPLCQSITEANYELSDNNRVSYIIAFASLMVALGLDQAEINDLTSQIGGDNIKSAIFTNQNSLFSLESRQQFRQQNPITAHDILDAIDLNIIKKEVLKTAHMAVAINYQRDFTTIDNAYLAAAAALVNALTYHANDGAEPSDDIKNVIISAIRQAYPNAEEIALDALNDYASAINAEFVASIQRLYNN